MQSPARRASARLRAIQLAFLALVVGAMSGILHSTISRYVENPSPSLMTCPGDQRPGRDHADGWRSRLAEFVKSRTALATLLPANRDVVRQFLGV
jgi:hypothetical protein